MNDEAAHLIRALELTDPMRESTMRAAVQALKLPRASRGLDIGCGIGLQTLLLAEAVGPGGRIAGLDIAAPVLQSSIRRTRMSGMADRVSFGQGDMRRLPFGKCIFDWAWSADCVGYPAADLPPMLKEIRRVLRPGATVAVLAWSSQQLLPGHTMLEARLNAHCSAYAPFLDGQAPRAHFQRALHAFAEAGLVSATAKTFLGELRAPLTPRIRAGLVSLLKILWDLTGEGVSTSDVQECHRLCSPESPDFIGDLPEYYGFFTYTMFSGQVPGDS